jgi:peptidoglycan/xylan/chitin deacetylase (PgdA/CDA1 family)
MRTIRGLGMRGVSVEEGLGHLGDNAKSNLVILTFDDGYVDTFTWALPILEKFGFTATCYLVAGAIGLHNHWDAALSTENKSLMNHTQVSHWLAAGMEIGSHTVSHPRLSQFDEQVGWQEIFESRNALREMFQVPVNHFAYPFGDYSDTTLEMVKRAGYHSAMTVSPGLACATDDRYQLPRVFVDGERGWVRFLFQIATRYEDSRRRSLCT